MTSAEFSSATRAQTRPIGPAPMTAIRASGSTRARASAWTALASGSTIAAVSKLIESGISWTEEAGTETASAKAPGRWMPTIRRVRQRWSRPAMQWSQWPQLSSGLTTTRRPSAVVPANSWPMISGGTRNSVVAIPWSSLPQMPTLATVTRTSPSSAAGKPTSCISTTLGRV